MGNGDSKELAVGSSSGEVAGSGGGGGEKEIDHPDNGKDALTERSSSEEQEKEKIVVDTHPQQSSSTNNNNNNNKSTNDHRPRRTSKSKSKKNGSVSTPKRKNRSSSSGQGGHHQARDDAEGFSRKPISDEQVHVNLAMSDLMAYLQVVANNSNQLPPTKRDDPDLDRFVTSLSQEDYARKTAAFVPADVRVIGGTFTRYGRVWDLPTKAEYTACDGAQEPGRSYGGACANAMLKVLYDAANNDQAEAMEAEKAADALFDDDEDEDDDEDGEGSAWGRSFKSGFSIDKDFPNQCTITWKELLRKMKAEIKDIEYKQIPKITSSRKLDLNKPFSLVPDNFDPDKGKKRSLLIGCNYRNLPGAELKASHDDVRSMKDYIVNCHGFPESDELMTILLDDEDHKYPTFLNIVEAFKVLSEESQPGDAVFVQFSGHGGRVLDAPDDSEAQSYDEVIVPCDYKVSGLIRDTLIFKTLLAPMRYGVTVTVMIDCCDTGMVLELPYSWSTKSSEKSLAKMSMNEDFSFMRFLKVVKTLYETSTFTQLGKTVGSALNTTGGGAPTSESSKEDAEMSVASDKFKSTDAIIASHETILDALTEACKPARRGATKCVDQQDIKDVTCGHSKRERQSLFEQVLNCTLLGPPEEEYFSDEDTFRTGTYDDDVPESFESLTEDEEDFQRRSGRGRRRTRR